jgi:hypothetical protein
MPVTFVDNALAVLGDIGFNATNLHLLESHLDQVIPFVGAGLSCESGYPVWSRFLETAAERFGLGSETKGYIATGQFEEAAEFVAERYPNAFDDFLRECFTERKLRRPMKSGAASCLPGIVHGPVLTTNFDHLLEIVFEDAGKPFGRVFPGSHIREASRAIQLNQPFLLKLHGDYNEADSRVLTLREYDREYGGREPNCVDFDLPLPKILMQALAARPLLFLGCSLRGDRTTQFIAAVARKYEGTMHFAVLSDEEKTPSRLAELDRWNIRPLFFPANNFNKIGQFLKCIAEIRPPDLLRGDVAAKAGHETIDVSQADVSIHKYAARLQRPNMAPLLASEAVECVGQNLLTKLMGPSDVLLLGRSGLGKSFHLEHYRRICFQFNEVPILVYARYYKGDLPQAISESIGQYTKLTSTELLEATEQLGRRPVLIVDGWNECPEPLQMDLGNQLGALQLRSGARLIVAAQTPPTHELFARVSKIQLAPLRQEQKKAIFEFHAGEEKADIPGHFYEQLSTAFDLKLAGSCQITNGTRSRAELYSAYVRAKLPSAVARGVLRKLAWYMGENFKPALSINEYERIVDKILGECGAPLPLCEELLKSRLVTADGNVITFEHDLLKEYFRAEHILRHCETTDLASRLKEPKYAGLSDFVIPFLADDEIVRTVLFNAGPELLDAAFHGWLGPTAASIVRGEYQRVLTECRNRLPEIALEAQIENFNDGRYFVSSACVVKTTCMSDFDKVLWALLADNLNDDDVLPIFLELLSAGEKALKNASQRAGREYGVKPKAIWQELLHWHVIAAHPGPVHPLLYVCQQVRQNHFGHSTRLHLRDALLKRLHDGQAGDLEFLLLMSELRYSDSIHVMDVVTLARQAWGTGLPTVRMEALDFIHSNASAIREAGQEAEAEIISLLDSFDVKDNIWLSTQWLDTRASFDGFDPGISIDDALEEFRRILAAADSGNEPLYELERQNNPDITFAQFIAEWASGSLSKMFEDVFQEVYGEAFNSLSSDERKKLLVLALDEPRIELFTDYYLTQLCRTGPDGAEHIFRRFGSKIDPDTSFPQGSVKCFVTAHQVWASLCDEPIPYTGGSSLDHQAWATVGELIFWLSRNHDAPGNDRIAALCRELILYSTAVPGVLKQISSCEAGMPVPALNLLLEQCRDAVRAVLHEALQFEGSLTCVFGGIRAESVELFRWTIRTLGHIGDRMSISLLRKWTSNSVYGADAIRAIEQIERSGWSGGLPYLHS